jgi:hypothetical protein
MIDSDTTWNNRLVLYICFTYTKSLHPVIHCYQKASLKIQDLRIENPRVGGSNPSPGTT